MAEAGPVVVLDPTATNGEVDRVIRLIGEAQPGVAMARGDRWAAVALGDRARHVDLDVVRGTPAVERVVDVAAPYRLASREVFGEDTSVFLGGDGIPTVEIGGRGPIAVMAACPAARRSDERLSGLVTRARDAGAVMLFAGVLAPASIAADPDANSAEAMERVRQVADRTGLAVCVEVSDHRQIGRASALADVLQVGSRSMQDFNLLREMGRADRPVILRRGFGATIEEFLLAAEYVLSHGNGRVILCESGIRTFDATGSPRFEINAIPVLKRATHLPLMADPAHAIPHARLMPAVARAAVAAGADGVVVELTDEEGESSAGAIGVSAFRALMAELDPIAIAVGRRMERR